MNCSIKRFRARYSLTILAVILCVSGTASAQGFLSKLKGDSAQSTPAADAANGPLLQHFQGSYSGLLTAQSQFAEAFELKDLAGGLAAEAKSLGAGTVDASTLKKVKSTSEAAQQQLDAQMAEEKVLSAEGRQAYGRGLSSYAVALFEGTKCVNDSQQFTSRTKSNPLTLLGGEGRAAAYVVKEVPGYLKNLQASSKAAMSYASRNKIEVPKDATSLLDGM